MIEFFKSFGSYFKDAQFDTILFWAFPLGTIVFNWLLTTVGLKIFSKRKKLKTVFVVNRAWMVSALIAAAILIGLISFWWSQNFYAKYPLQLSLLISLLIAMIIPIISLLTLRGFFTQDRVKEITDQPKTPHQLDETIVLTKNAFSYNKFYYLLPLVGFLMVLFYLYKGTNLISLVFDNSGSMNQTSAINALDETFSKLEENNEIVLTTLNGINYQPNTNAKTSMTELMQTTRSSDLHAGNITAYQSPVEARSALFQVSGFDCCSPISESIWKNYLFIKETKSDQTFTNKLLIIISDGDDNYMNESLRSGQFFFDDQDFAEFFPPENVFIIDFSSGTPSPLMQRFQNAGCDIYPAEDNKQAYLDALDNALQSFKNNWHLIHWTIVIFSLFTIIGLLIQPKKII